jgi:aminopeptidase N
MKPLLLGVVLLAAACTSTPAFRPAREIVARRPAFDVEHYRIELTLNPAERSLEGECRVRLWPTQDGLQQVELDLQGLQVREVRDERARVLAHTHEGDRLRVQLAQALQRDQWTEVRVRYGGMPRTGLHWAAPREGQPTQAWTQGECDESRGWFPCLDEPFERATHELLVTAPAGWTIVAAGERIERVESASTVFERWRTTYPHPAYLTTLVAGEFAQASGAYGSTPLWFVGPRELESELLPAFEETDEILAYFSELTGVRYPHAKYAQACVDDFHYGGMENISATTLTETALLDKKGRADQPATGLIAHEAAHQWFGDLLTCAEWSDIWLNEGFATYLTHLWTERSRGRDVFLCDMRDTQLAYLAASGSTPRRGIVHGVAREPMELFFSGHVYPGGAARLHLLRGMMGDEVFTSAIRRWTGMHTNRAVTTKDLIASFQVSSGLDLSRFEREWLRAKGHPVVVAQHERTERGVLVQLEQVQDASQGIPRAFAFPLDIEVGTATGSVVQRFTVDAETERFELEADEVLWVRLDPHAWVPMDLRHRRTADELLTMAARVKDAHGRREAVAVLAKELRDGTNEPLKVQIAAALLERLPLERDERVRRALVQALAPVVTTTALEAVCAAAQSDASPLVRVAALETLAGGAFGETAQPRVLSAARAALQDAPSWAVEGAAVQVLAAQDAYTQIDLERELAVASPHGVREARVMAAIGRLTTPEARAYLAQYALDESKEDAPRSIAIAALAADVQADAGLARRLHALLDSPRYRVRRAAIDQLGRLTTAQTAQALMLLHARSAYDDERLRIEDTASVRALK